MNAEASAAAPELVSVAQAALASNKAHQYALKVYSDRLQAELAAVDKLLVGVSLTYVDEEDSGLDVPGEIQIRGGRKVSPLLNTSELAHERSPFYADVSRRQRYLQATTIHSMRPRELSVLADAVRNENRRILTLKAHQQGTQPPAADSPELDENTEGLDWNRIAQTVVNVTAASYVARTAQECKVRWLGDRHPKFNHACWTTEERDRAKELVSEFQRSGERVDWVDIAERLGTNRTPIDVMRNAIVRQIHTWDPSSEKRLAEAVEIYGVENWSLVAKYISEDALPASCQAHWHRSLDPSVKKGRWTDEEDERLKRAIVAFGKSWVDVATVMEGRTSDQCREHFQEYGKKANKKGRWNEEEDALLREAVEELGTKRWKEVAERVEGRSDTQVWLLPFVSPILYVKPLLCFSAAHGGV
ncbi:hypothetical protein K488DRAFT_41939 [Vararia minispora EC-137]|uniref:Uncharacterized protein n=1 Tax=Vararia minispora EC-137 TaxID=1314806 RepID=A0ACB8QWD7_9AGAM|nr:hypothetical protein K488DRAFT_41939 [Vararia minispora EC-137]